ncbi:MAG: M1 family metallopeptidase [Bacteroidetes bacterium]|nr:M1 family metallopeptidase [Bacteroidota bacterium]MBU1721075.1 M1 family metallopeptidase [Bacteroidota bacterium]
MKIHFLVPVLFALCTSAFSQSGIKPLSLKNHTAERTAVELMDRYDVKFCWLNISAERDTTWIEGYVETLAEAIEDVDTVAFELLADLSVDSCLINGQSLTFLRESNYTKISLPATISQGTSFTCRVYYKGTPPAGGFFNGISTKASEDYGNHVTWTLSEPWNAYHWWPCKQSLTDKLDSVWVYITTDTSNLAGSEGVLENITDLGNGKHRFEWKCRHTIDYYLVSIAVSDYQELSFYAPLPDGDSVLVQNYIYGNPACLTDNEYEIRRTSDFLYLYSELFGIYPYKDEKYGHCMAPISGAMEHQTMTTTGMFFFEITCHELSHQWFGNYITCATWNDIWINEGFASYNEYLALENLGTAGSQNNWMTFAHEKTMEEPGGSVYVYPWDVWNVNMVFSYRLSYKKGASILHALRFELQNDTVFFEILRQHLQAHANGNATGDDFFNTAEQVSGKDLDYFKNQWYYGQGYPIFDIGWSYSNDTLHLSIDQTGSSSTSYFETLLQIKANRQIYDTTFILQLTGTSQSFDIPCSEQVNSLTIDPYGWIPDSVRTNTNGLSEFSDGSGICVFPSPFSDRLTIVGVNSPYGWQLISLSGDIAAKGVGEGRILQLPTAIPGGCYLLEIRTFDGVYRKKIMKAGSL